MYGPGKNIDTDVNGAVAIITLYNNCIFDMIDFVVEKVFLCKFDE